MKRLNSKSMSSITHFFIYALTLLLVWEWLRPIPVITNTGEIELFVWFTFASALLIYLRLPVYVTAPVLLAGSIYGLHLIFFEGSFLSREGGMETVRALSAEIGANVSLIINGNFAELTDLFRSFLLFMLLALICYLLYYWVLYKGKVFLFLLSTVVYITILDTFTPVDASQAIIRIIIIGFFMLTLLQMLKVQDEERAIGRRKKAFFSPAWMYTLIVIIGISVAAGLLAPKPEPQWADPVPAMRVLVGAEGSGGGSGVSRVGYGENDERLGGGFVQDEGTAFRAEADRDSYWRGESKEEYTGQGWVSEPVYVESELIYEDAVDFPLYRDEADLEQSEVSIEMAEEADFGLLFYPGQLRDVSDVEAEAGGNSLEENDLQFYTDVEAGRVQGEARNGGDVRFSSYDIEYDDASFNLESLRSSSEEDPEEIAERYTQLPDDLPERVGELAADITEEYDNRYEKAEAVEAYFSDNDFEYRTDNVPVPDEGEDYVDQFLFETQAGYCDNYSTSMAVMLRTLDIPTRWVKGFTSGEEIEELENGNTVYEVTNGNAHSWVEVYFPETGWVPFEPTQGFTNYAEFEEETPDVDTDQNESTNEAEDPNIPEPDGSTDNMLEEGTDTEEGAGGASGEDFTLFTMKNVLISLPLLIFIMLAYQKQNVFQNKFFLYRYRMLGSDASFTTAYKRLLWILANEGLPRASGETLREYAKRVDLALSSRAMTKLTNTYEKIHYGGKEPDGEWEARRKDWEEIVKSLNA
ncbi:transglutaminase domain-containing protein [Alkalicoccus halolimnae]|uniref:Transglutaminase domain-containing protein n=1 Tax=Alkalicoccus halolimnae TaxID=1667239 RepID=A0A5C7F8Y9_9BACI|nr:transglutaminase domain-containing protein [Alkalicoccus halolimnae]TXF86060.1 transglutaminase domain-containing protein [Alkalicoccus halolimnae]